MDTPDAVSYTHLDVYKRQSSFSSDDSDDSGDSSDSDYYEEPTGDGNGYEANY